MNIFYKSIKTDLLNFWIIKIEIKRLYSGNIGKENIVGSLVFEIALLGNDLIQAKQQYIGMVR